MDGLAGGFGLRSTQVAMILVAVAALVTAPLSGQRAASGSALIVVPPVAELEVHSASSVQRHTRADGTVAAVGSMVVRVRANHDWRVLVASSKSAGSSGEAARGARVWWRATVVGAGSAGEFRELSEGHMDVAAEGEGGQVLIRIDYRIEGPRDLRLDTAPLTYTLASL